MRPSNLRGDSLKDSKSSKNLYLWSRRTGRAGPTIGACLAAALALFGALLVLGCSGAPKRDAGGLLERFAPAEPAADHAPFLIPIAVDRGGEKKRAIVLVAPSAARASLAGFRGRVILRLMVVPMFNVGDGLQMALRLLDGGVSATVCSRYFDPARRFEDRRWTPMEVTVDICSSTAQLEICVSSGPGGDLTGDWLAFADVRISPGVGR